MLIRAQIVGQRPSRGSVLGDRAASGSNPLQRRNGSGPAGLAQ